MIPRNFVSDEDCAATWESLSPDKEGGAGIGTFIHIANEHGFTERVADADADKAWAENCARLATQRRGTTPDNGQTQFHCTAPDGIPDKFRIIPLSELAKLLPPAFYDKQKTISKALGTLILVAAKYGGGKTLLLLTIALILVIEHGSTILYCCSEGFEEVTRKRISAMCKRFGVDIEAVEKKLHIIPGCPQLRDEDERREFVSCIQTQIGNPGAIFIDTLARANVGGDENSTKDATLLVAGVRELQEAFGGALAFVAHHIGKNEDKGPRGAVAIQDDADGIWLVKFDPATLTVDAYIDKVRGSAAGFHVVWRGQVIDDALVLDPTPLTREEAADALRHMRGPTAADTTKERRSLIGATLREARAYGLGRSLSTRELAERRTGDPKNYPTLDAWRVQVHLEAKRLDNGSRPRGANGHVQLEGYFEVAIFPAGACGVTPTKRWFLPSDAADDGEDA